jgi:hypothetical protein
MADEEMQDMLCSACGGGGAAGTAIGFGQPIGYIAPAPQHARAGPATLIPAT